MFHKTTPELQDQDQDRFFWSQTGLVLRPTVSDHITGIFNKCGLALCTGSDGKIFLRGRAGTGTIIFVAVAALYSLAPTAVRWIYSGSALYLRQEGYAMDQVKNKKKQTNKKQKLLNKN